MYVILESNNQTNGRTCLAYVCVRQCGKSRPDSARIGPEAGVTLVASKPHTEIGGGQKGDVQNMMNNGMPTKGGSALLCVYMRDGYLMPACR